VGHAVIARNGRRMCVPRPLLMGPLHMGPYHMGPHHMLAR